MRFFAALTLCALAACGGGEGASVSTQAKVEIVDFAGVEAALAARTGRPLLVNFWALW